VSAFYQAVGWNRQKRLYDGTIAAGVVLYLALFVGIGAARYPDATAETLFIRGLGSAAFILLEIVLCIGPLARLEPRFLPLLYNRRHLGVTTFTVGLAHATFALVQFHSQGNVNPLVSVLTGNPRVNDLGQFPFEPLGLAALLILFLMAATSHDFWLANLTAPVWKALHMLAYLAYALLVFHVTLGVLQAETSPILSGALAAGVTLVIGLHLMAGWSALAGDRDTRPGLADGWVDVCAVDEIAEKRGRVVCIGGERVAVFRYDGRVSCVSNVCQHQNGPLGEGKVVDGLITCPWHGYQYCPDTGRSPAPFTERIPTFRVRVVAGRVHVDPRPNPAGTKVEPAVIGGPSHA
jgi:sulfoxide reductase heme-binding subunit YedZ